MKGRSGQNFEITSQSDVLLTEQTEVRLEMRHVKCDSVQHLSIDRGSDDELITQARAQARAFPVWGRVFEFRKFLLSGNQ